MRSVGGCFMTLPRQSFLLWNWCTLKIRSKTFALQSDSNSLVPSLGSWTKGTDCHQALDPMEFLLSENVSGYLIGCLSNKNDNDNDLDFILMVASFFNSHKMFTEWRTFEFVNINAGGRKKHRVPIQTPTLLTFEMCPKDKSCDWTLDKSNWYSYQYCDTNTDFPRRGNQDSRHIFRENPQNYLVYDPHEMALNTWEAK